MTAAHDELKRAGLMDKDSDYDGMIGEAVSELLDVLGKQGHSGMSHAMTLTIFNKAAKGDPLSPLTTDKSEWNDVAEMNNGKTLWQNNRCCHIFSEDLESGKAYNVEGKSFSDDNGDSYFISSDSRVWFDLPGYPPEKQYIKLEEKADGNDNN